MLFNKARIYSYLWIFILILCIFPSLISLFHTGFFVSDDGNWMGVRLSAFYEMIRGGQIPPRFLMQLNHGYGYPVSDFLYPLFLYLGIPIHIIGFSFVNTIKVLTGISMVVSGVFSYFW